MAKFRNIKVKIKGGGTRMQRAKVLASGKLKFVKNLTKKVTKSRSRKPKSGKNKRKSQSRNTPKRPRNTVAKKKKSVSRSRGIFDKITKNKFVKGAALGLGGGAIAIQVTERFAPQFSSIAAPIGAFVFGGPIGLVASVLLQGGLGFLSGNGSANGGSRDTL